MDDVSGHSVQGLDPLRVLPELRAALVQHVGEALEEVVRILIREVHVGDNDI